MPRTAMKKEEIIQHKINIITKAKKFIEEKGYRNATVNNISEITGLNKAYLYRFFKDLNEIKIYCSVMDLKEYIDELIEKNIFYNNDTSINNYYEMWKIFANHSLKHRESFKILYFSEHSDKLPKIIKDYFSLFPKHFCNLSEDMIELLSSANMNHRTDYFLYPALDKKATKSEIQLISKLSKCYFRELLFDTDDIDDKTIANQVDDLMYVLKFLNKAFLDE